MIQRTVLISEPHIFGNTARYGGHQYARVFAQYGWRVILLSATFNATRLIVPGFKTNSGVKQEYYDLWAEKGRQIEPNITNYCLAHLLPTKLRYERPFRYAAPYLYLPSVESILKAHAIDAVDLLWLNGNQDWLLDKAVPHRKMLMRIIDDYSGFSNGYDNYHPLMKATAARADGVFACSEQVRDVFSRLVQGIQIAPNGVDFEHFAQHVYSEPSEIQEIPHPRVIYVGAIAEWFDLDLVVELAHRLPQHHFIIFGGWTREQPANDTLPVNIHILGPVKYDVVPHVLAYSDIGLVPFKDTKLVRGVSPIKVYEYLAASLPVVTLSWRELERESLPVFLAHSVDEFERGIRAATRLSASERESLRDFVKGCSWEKRLQGMLTAVGISLE